MLVVPAVLAGSEAIYYARETGLAGDDYTGLLALAAAPILLALGLWTLWTSRRLGDNLVRRYGRRMLKTAGVLVVAFVVVLPLSVAHISSHVSRADVPAAKLGAAYEDVKLHTSDGLELDGWYVPSTNGAAVLVFPGRTGAQKQARMLVRHGYGVLLYDRRGEGDSEGDPNGFGWDFDKDIHAGVDFLAARADVEPGRIGALGLSVGGEMVLQTAAETEHLAAIVSEGAGSRSMVEEIDDASGIDKVATGLTYGVRDLTNSVLQDRLPPKNLETFMPKIAPRPVFLIHAGADDAGHRNPDLYRAAGQPKQIWEAKGAHTDGIDGSPRNTSDAWSSSSTARCPASRYQSRSRSITRATSTRELTSSLRKMLRMCVSMVLTLRNSSAAISGLVRRSVTSAAISASRSVSVSSSAPSALPGAERRWTRRPSLRNSCSAAWRWRTAP